MSPQEPISPRRQIRLMQAAASIALLDLIANGPIAIPPVARRYPNGDPHSVGRAISKEERARRKKLKAISKKSRKRNQ